MVSAVIVHCGMFSVLLGAVFGACPADWQVHDAACYRLINIPQAFWQADQVCQLVGGNLTDIQSAEENEFIANISMSTGNPQSHDRNFVVSVGATNLIANDKRTLQWLNSNGTGLNYTNFDAWWNPCDAPQTEGSSQEDDESETKHHHGHHEGGGGHHHGGGGGHGHHDWGCRYPRCLRLYPATGLWYTGPCAVPLPFVCKTKQI